MVNDLDVSVATSMRHRQDFREMADLTWRSPNAVNRSKEVGLARCNVQTASRTDCRTPISFYICTFNARLTRLCHGDRGERLLPRGLDANGLDVTIPAIYRGTGGMLAFLIFPTSRETQ